MNSSDGRGDDFQETPEPKATPDSIHSEGLAFHASRMSGLAKETSLIGPVIGDKFGQGKYIVRERKYRGLRWKCGSVAGVEV